MGSELEAGSRLQQARRPLAQFALLVVIISTFLPWSDSRAGTEFAEGQLAALGSLIAIGLIAAKLRIAWMGTGFVLATLFRAFTTLDEVEFGIVIGLVAAVVALALVVWTLFAEIPRPD